MYEEYVGLSREALVLIERLRKSPEETRSTIVERVLSPLARRDSVDSGASRQIFDLGQGVYLYEGEKLMLFLSRQAKQSQMPDAVAEIRSDGFYLDGRRINESPKRALDPAMKIVQAKKGHRNQKGEIISHSAWRDWHVRRDERLISLFELKDPALANRRNRYFCDKTAEELGL